MGEVKIPLVLVMCVIVIGMVALVIMGTAMGEVSWDGLVAEWHFDGDAKDSSGNGNDGTIYGATFVDGKSGKGLSFNGVSDYVERSFDPSFTPGTKSWTVEAWIKAPSRSDGDGEIISWYRCGANPSCNTPDNAMYELWIDENNKAGWQVIDDNGNKDRIISLSDVADDRWHFIVGTFDPSQHFMKLYVDGQLINSTSVPLYSINDGGVHIPFEIGRVFRTGWGNPDGYFKGIIDEVRIYNHALSAEEIKALYDLGNTPTTNWILYGGILTIIAICIVVLTMRPPPAPDIIKEGFLIASYKWARSPESIARTIPKSETNGCLIGYIIVQPNEVATIMKDGKAEKVVDSGKVSIGGLLNINSYFKDIEVVMMDTSPKDDNWQVEKLWTSDKHDVAAKGLLKVRIADPKKFFSNGICAYGSYDDKRVRSLTLKDINERIKSEVLTRVLQPEVNIVEIEDIYGNRELQFKIENEVELQLKQTLEMWGLELLKFTTEWDLGDYTRIIRSRRDLEKEEEIKAIELDIKRGYEVLPNNDLNFGIRVENKSNFAVMDVTIIIDYPKNLFSMNESDIQNLNNIIPAGKRTAKYILKPLGCIHNEQINALITYKDHTGKKQTLNMRPKEVHCVCPFLREKPMSEGEYSRLVANSEFVQEGISFKGISVEELARFMGETCRHMLYKVREYDFEGKKVIYLSGESLGEKAYYLLTAVIQKYKGLTQVVLRAHSDKKYGLNGFMNEIADGIRHLVGTVRSANEIGIIENTHVINIIDSVIQRTNFNMSEGGDAHVSIRDSLVQLTDFGKKKEE